MNIHERLYELRDKRTMEGKKTTTIILGHEEGLQFTKMALRQAKHYKFYPEINQAVEFCGMKIIFCHAPSMLVGIEEIGTKELFEQVESIEREVKLCL